MKRNEIGTSKPYSKTPNKRFFFYSLFLWNFLFYLTLKIQLLSLLIIMFAAIGIAHQDGKIDVMLVVNTIKTP
jgi:hypothetical protein